MKSTNQSQVVLTVRDNRLSTNDGSFSISFYFKTAADVSSGGLFEFIDSQFGTPNNSFQMQYSDSAIIVTSTNKVISSYEIIQRQSAWTFLTFTFDAQTSEFAVFSEHGMAFAPTVQPFLAASNTFNNGGIRIGYSTMAGKGLNRGDAVSCFAFYSKTLQWPEVKQLQQA